MLKILASLMMLVCLVGCGPHHVDYFPYNDDGTLKPHIALIPVIDRSGSDVPWSLAQEMTLGIRFQAMDSGELYLLSRSEMLDGMQKTQNINLFDTDLSYSTCFGNADFVVAVELIEHKEECYNKCVHSCPLNLSGYVLVMKARLRIIDVRCQEPRVLLQEIVKLDQSIPRCSTTKTGFNLIPYGAESYPQTPYALAHRGFQELIVRRIEETTWGAK